MGFTETSREAVAALIFAESPDAIFIESLTGQILEVNQAACDLHRLPREELVGRNVLDLVPPEVRDEVRRDFPRLASGEWDRVHGFSWSSDGRRTPVHLRVRRIEYHGEPALLLMVRDVTEEHAARERLELAVTSAGLGLWDWDVETGRASFNEAWARIQGYSLDEVEPTFDAWRRRVHPDDQARVDRLLADHFAGLTDTIRFEYRVRHKDGFWKWIATVGRIVDRHADGRPRRVLGFNRDINARKCGELALRQSEERYRELVNSIDPIVWEAAAPDWDFTFVSDQAARVLGYPVARWYDGLKAWAAWIHEEDRGRVVEFCKAETMAGRDHRMEYRMIHADGSIVWIRDVVHVIKDERGIPVATRGVMLDITASKHASEALAQRELEQRQAAARSRMLLNELDHRVRNNLASLRALLDLYADRPERTDHLAHELRAHLLAMTAAHEQIAASGGEAVLLSDLIRSIGFESATDVEGRVTIDGEPVRLHAAQVSPIAIVFQELVTNARKHGALGERGGAIDLRWRVVPADRGGPWIDIEWRETTERPIAPRGGHGIGFHLIEGFVNYELGGECSLTFDDHAFACRLRWPLGADAATA